MWCAYADGELDNTERHRLHDHLATCRECFVRLAEITRAVDAGRGQESNEDDPLLWWVECTLAHGKPCRLGNDRRVLCSARMFPPECNPLPD
jgi:anti-sigma factor RsiW